MLFSILSVALVVLTFNSNAQFPPKNMLSQEDAQANTQNNLQLKFQSPLEVKIMVDQGAMKRVFHPGVFNDTYEAFRGENYAKPCLNSLRNFNKNSDSCLSEVNNVMPAVDVRPKNWNEVVSTYLKMATPICNSNCDNGFSSIVNGVKDTCGFQQTPHYINLEQSRPEFFVGMSNFVRSLFCSTPQEYSEGSVPDISGKIINQATDASNSNLCMAQIGSMFNDYKVMFDNTEFRTNKRAFGLFNQYQMYVQMNDTAIKSIPKEKLCTPCMKLYFAKANQFVSQFFVGKMDKSRGGSTILGDYIKLGQYFAGQCSVVAPPKVDVEYAEDLISQGKVFSFVANSQSVNAAPFIYSMSVVSALFLVILGFAFMN